MEDYLYACIAYPCLDERVEGSGFCVTHKAEYDKSPYPALLQEMMALSVEDKKPKKKVNKTRSAKVSLVKGAK